MDLNNDVATEILLRLPVQSVLRVRSVCKSWRNIIDSSTFRESHLQNQHHHGDDDDETLFLQQKRNVLDCRSFPCFIELAAGRISPCVAVGPINGLVCLYDKSQALYPEHTCGLSIAFYNPCLDKIKILPRSPICSSGRKTWASDYCIRTVGFGFVDNGYKVVQLTQFLERRTNVEVYSGTTNTWRKLITDHTSFDEELFMEESIRPSVYTKSGSWVWANWRTYRGHKNVILSFNMRNEVFETISYPDLEDRKVDVRSSVVFAKDDDSFSLFVYTLNYQTLEVWEVERSDKERRWTRVRGINVAPLTFGEEWRRWPRPFAMLKRNLVIWKEPNFIFYDYSTEKVTKCCEVLELDTNIFVYKGSLILP